jgi:hypothetical protein
MKKIVAGALLVAISIAIGLTISTIRVSLAGEDNQPTVAVSDETTEVSPTARPARVRAGLWKLRRELRKAGRQEDANLVTRALRSQRVMECLTEEICIKYAADHPGGVPGDWIDELSRFFQWLIENADEIIKLIMLIISLFDPMALDNATAWQIPPPPIYELAA